MKTPMQEMLKYVHDESQLFGSARQILISKIQEMIEKEKEIICNAFSDAQHGAVESRWTAEEYFEEIFNNK